MSSVKLFCLVRPMRSPTPVGRFKGWDPKGGLGSGERGQGGGAGRGVTKGRGRMERKGSKGSGTGERENACPSGRFLWSPMIV